MLADLLAELGRRGDGPLVGLELFFDGNDDPASIGCNLPEHPGVARFDAVLRSIRARPEVSGVLVEISEVLGPDEWPFADTVHVLTAAPPDVVAAWAAELHPEPPVAGHRPDGAPEVRLWWD